MRRQQTSASLAQKDVLKFGEAGEHVWQPAQAGADGLVRERELGSG